MTMIPTFLQFLAATARDLVRTGKAVHVTEATAQELDLLAGLPWKKTRIEFASIDEDGSVCGANRKEWVKQITPADLALGWLLASKCEAHKNGALTIPNLRITDAEWVTRAAECAELAVTCAWYPFMPPGVERVKDTEDGAGLWIGIPMVTNPVAGSREGARAAWGFIHGHMLVEAGNAWDRYRRELEAM